MGLHGVVATGKDLSNDVSITNLELILTKLELFLLPGYGQTDTTSKPPYGNMSTYKKFQVKTQNLELAVDLL